MDLIHSIKKNDFAPLAQQGSPRIIHYQRHIAARCSWHKARSIEFPSPQTPQMKCQFSLTRAKLHLHCFFLLLLRSQPLRLVFLHGNYNIGNQYHIGHDSCCSSCKCWIALGSISAFGAEKVLLICSPLYNGLRVKKYVPIGIVTIANVNPNSLNITDLWWG